MTPLIAGLVKSGFDLIDDLWTSDEEKAEQKLKIEKLAAAGDSESLQAHVSLLKGQMAINALEAQHKSVFVAGWRPFVGWVCGGGLGYVGLVDPLLRFVARVIFGYEGEFPVIDTTTMIPVLLGMLGISHHRSEDKKNNVGTNSFK